MKKSELRQIIREEIQKLNEASKKSFGDMWEKALKIAKTKGWYSPHMKKKYPTMPIGYTNSEYLSKVPNKYPKHFGYHSQAFSDMERALYGANPDSASLYLNWGDDAAASSEDFAKSGEELVNILKKAGFKVTWNGDYRQKIKVSGFNS